MTGWGLTLGALGLAGACFLAGWDYGTSKAAARAAAESERAALEYAAALREAEERAAKISMAFTDSRTIINNLYADNQRLISQLRLSAAENATRADKDTGRVTKCPACPDVSAGVAADITELTYRADVAANYAAQCYSWIKTLEGSGGGGKVSNK